MKIKGPDGQTYEFPDDAKDAEIEAFFNPEPVTAPPQIKPSGYEQWRMDYAGPRMGLFGPEAPEEILTGPNLVSFGRALPGATQRVLEPVATAATDLARTAMQEYGVTPPPIGEGLWQGEYPITAGAPVGWALRRFLPEVAQGLDVGAGQLLGGATEPGTLATIPFAPFKPVLGYFGASIAASIPEEIQALAESQGPSEAAAGAIRLGGGLAMGGLIGRSLLTKGTRYASRQQEAAKVYGDVRAQPGEGPGQVPAQVSGEGVLAQAQRLAPEEEVLLRPGLEQNRSLGLGHEVEVLDRMPNDPENVRIFQGQPAIVDAEGNFLQPGKITMSRAAFEAWRKQIRPEIQEQALNSLLAEEGIHTITKATEAIGYLESLTGPEIEIGKRNYLGGRTEAEAGLNPERLGFELLRQRIQQLLRLTTTEVAELAGRERWTVRGLEIISNIIRRARELLGTKAAQAGKEVTQQLLDRAERNIKRATEEASKIHEETGLEYGGEQPFGIRRVRGYDFDPEIKDRDVQVTVSKFTLPDGQSRSYVQTDGIVNGENVWSLNPELMREAGHDIPSSADILANVEPGRYRLDAIRDMLPDREAMPEQKPGTVRLYHGGPETTWFTKDWARAASYGENVSYVDVPADVAATAQAQARAKGSGTGSDHVLSPDLAKQAKDLPDRLQPQVHEVGPAGIRRKGGKALPGEQELPMGPGRGGHISQPEMAPAAEVLAKAQAATYEPVTPKGISDLAIDVLTGVHPTRSIKTKGAALTGVEIREVTKGAEPDFKEFVRQAQTRFGPLQPGQLRDAWDDAVRQRIVNAPGKALVTMARDLGLSKQLKLETPGGELRDIPDPPPPIPAEGTPLAPLPGVTRPHFVIQGRPMQAPLQGPGKPIYGPYDVPFVGKRGGKALSEAQFTKGQQLRARVMGAIYEFLMRDAEGGRKFLNRTEVDAESIADPRIETKQPVYNHITTEDHADVQNLGRILTDDARAFGGEKTQQVIGGKVVTLRKKGYPVSATKRLTAIQNRQSGKVSLVSTYRDGRRGPVMRDPASPGTYHATLDSILKRYRVIASVLLDEPVKDFRQDYKGISEFEADFGEPARDIVRRSEGYEPPPSVEQISPRRTFQLNEPITEEETASIMDQLIGEVGNFQEPNDVLLAIEALRDNPSSPAISGYSKLANQIEAKNPGLPTEAILNKLAQQIYENHSQAENFADFQRRTMAQGPAPSGKDVGVTLPGAKAAAPAAEVAPPAEGPVVPPTPRRPGVLYQSLRTATEGPFAPKVKALAEPGARPKPGRMLSPSEQAYVEEEAARKHPPLPSIYSKIVGGDIEGPAGIRRIAGQSAKFVDKTFVEGLRLYSEWMSERLARVGGPKSKALADGINMMIARERELYGELTSVLDSARKAAGLPSRGSTWLHGVEKVTPDTAITRAVGAVEGTTPIPGYADSLVQKARDANLEIGRLYQIANPKFTATGKFQRNLTAFGFDIIREGGGETWNKLVEGTAAANNIPPAQVEGFFKDWKAVLDKPGVDSEAIEKVNQDFQRKFPKAITHVKVAGMWQPVIHADLFNYLETAARRATHVAAFRELFPPTVAGRAAFAKLMQEVRAETPGHYHPDLTALMRALQGHPTDNYSNLSLVRPGQPLGEGARFLNQTLGNLFAKMVLTGQMFVQPGENIAGSTPVFLGYHNYLRGMARLMGSHLYRELEQQGAVNRAILDFSFDPTSPVRSTFRIAGNVTGKVFAEQFLNELQEASAAATAQVTAERIAAGTLSPWEKSMLPQTFRAMGFTQPQVVELMRGNPDLLGQFVGKASSFLTSGNKAIAESSRIGANRLFGSVFRFQAYPMMKANQFRKVLGNSIEAWQNGTAEERAASTYMLTRFLFGTAVQGALTVGITALFYEGLSGAKIRAQEAKDEMGQFFTESFLSTMSGPLYLLWRGSKDKGLKGIGEQATRMIFPFQVARELMDFAQGAGQYRDQSEFDRIAKFVRQKLPGTRAISQGLAFAGLSQENKELDAAISAFYRWRREKLGFTDYQPYLVNDERKQFRNAMRRLIAAMKSGDNKAYDKAMDDAYSSAPKAGAVKSSLRSRTILKGPDGSKLTEEQTDALRKHIGNRPVDLIQDFDAMLEAAAKE